VYAIIHAGPEAENATRTRLRVQISGTHDISARGAGRKGCNADTVMHADLGYAGYKCFRYRTRGMQRERDHACKAQICRGRMRSWRGYAGEASARAQKHSGAEHGLYDTNQPRRRARRRMCRYARYVCCTTRASRTLVLTVGAGHILLVREMPMTGYALHGARTANRS
jgi:hypothetical protein